MNAKLLSLLKSNGIDASFATMSAKGVAVRVSSKAIADKVADAFRSMKLSNVRLVSSFDEIVCMASHE